MVGAMFGAALSACVEGEIIEETVEEPNVELKYAEVERCKRSWTTDAASIAFLNDTANLSTCQIGGGELVPQQTCGAELASLKSSMCAAEPDARFMRQVHWAPYWP